MSKIVHLNHHNETPRVAALRVSCSFAGTNPHANTRKRRKDEIKRKNGLFLMLEKAGL